MIKHRLIFRLASVFGLVLSVGAVSAQKDTILRQEVEVVKAYRPAVIDANKINENPVIKDEEQKKPTFDYSISSQPVFSTFSVKNLEAATIVGKPKEELGYGLVRLGVGNYNKPYAELFFNNNKAKNSIFGLHFKHLSSHGKIKLKGGDRVKAPFSENNAEMFLKHMFKSSVLSFNADFSHNGFNYYGYPGDSIPSVLTDADPLWNNYTGTHQTFSGGGLNISLTNAGESATNTTLGFDFDYHYFGTKTGQREHFAEFYVNFRKPGKPVSFLLDVGSEFSQADKIWNVTLSEVARRQQTWFVAKPAVRVGNETINLKAGGTLWVVGDPDEKTALKLAPDVRLNFAPVKEIINVFAGIDGKLHHNHYSAIAYQNPFVDPEHDVRNHFEKFRFYGGFDGKFGPRTNFKIQADYSMFAGQPFYYLSAFRMPTMGMLPGPLLVNNTFKVLYDDMDQLKFNAEIAHMVTDKFNLVISGNYYKYTLNEQEKPWNLPEFDATLSLGYKITDQLAVSTEVYVIGKREAMIWDLGLWDSSPSSLAPAASIQVIPLDTAIDLNFKATYEVTRKFSLFAQLNNFGFQQYERWLGYPVQSFNFLGGLSYSF